LFCAVGKWNDWTTAFFYIKKNKNLLPFQNVLQSLVVNTDTTNTNNIDLSRLGEAFKNALIVVSIIPVTLMYLAAQKYFVKGLFIGSVKE
jgi:putative aldouronate transport system permease protein